MALASAIQEERRTDFEKLRNRLNNHYIKFLQADLDLGLTNGAISCPSGHRLRSEREEYAERAQGLP